MTMCWRCTPKTTLPPKKTKKYRGLWQASKLFHPLLPPSSSKPQAHDNRTGQRSKQRLRPYKQRPQGPTPSASKWHTKVLSPV